MKMYNKIFKNGFINYIKCNKWNRLKKIKKKYLFIYNFINVFIHEDLVFKIYNKLENNNHDKNNERFSHNV